MSDGQTKIDVPSTGMSGLEKNVHGMNHNGPLNKKMNATSLGCGSPSVPMKDIVKPTNHDVLCGRGGGTNNHVGNNHWRTLVSFNKRLYISLPKRQKMKVAQSIVRAVRCQIPPGRFLQKDPETGLWFDIGDQKAQDKTSQALREGAPDLRSDMEKESKKPKSGGPAENNTANVPGYTMVPSMGFPPPVVPMAMPGVMGPPMFPPMPFPPMPPHMFPFPMPMPGGPMVAGPGTPMFSGQMPPGGMMMPFPDQNPANSANKNSGKNTMVAAAELSKATLPAAGANQESTKSTLVTSSSNPLNNSSILQESKISSNEEKRALDLTESSPNIDKEILTQNSHTKSSDNRKATPPQMPEWTGEQPQAQQQFTALPDAPVLPAFISKTDHANNSNLSNPNIKSTPTTQHSIHPFMPPPPRRAPSLTIPKNFQGNDNLIDENDTLNYEQFSQYHDLMKQSFPHKGKNSDNRNHHSLIDDSDDEEGEQMNEFKQWDDLNPTPATMLNRDQSLGPMSTTSVFTDMSDVLSVDGISLESLSISKQPATTSLSRGNSRTGWGIEATSLTRGESNMSEMSLLRGTSTDFGYQSNNNQFALHMMTQNQQDESEQNQQSTQSPFRQSKDNSTNNFDSTSNHDINNSFYMSQGMVQDYRRTGEQMSNGNNQAPQNLVRGASGNIKNGYNRDVNNFQGMQNYSNVMMQHYYNNIANNGNNGTQFFETGAFDANQMQNQQEQSDNQNFNFTGS